jgi:phosphoglycolate phosphatase-like HAD superfamily hydrolase
LTWSDWNDPKGFWVFDTETREAEFVRSPFTLFEKITYTDDVGYDFTEVTGKYVKVVVASKKSQKKFDEFLLNVNLNSPIDVRVIESSSAEAVQEAVDVTDLVSTKDMIADVVDQLDAELDKQLLKTKVLDLYTEAYELTKGL